ncbi:MAG: FtsX-like permease family protein [Chloroflexota bacterium]|nr:FtsX-like permease family protein [Chloroflexota bacterium]
MKLKELISLIFFNLSQRKGRVMLTAIGVVIGSASIVVLVSLAQGLQQNATDQFGSIAEMSQITVYPDWEAAMPVSSGSGIVAVGEMVEPDPITSDALEEIAAIPGVREVIPRAYIMASAMMKFGKLESYGNIVGIGTDDLSTLGYAMLSGTSALSKGSVIIGQEVLRNFYNPSMRPGQEPPPPPDLQDQTIILEITKWIQDEGTGQGMETKKRFRLKVAGIIESSQSEADYTVYMPLDQVLDINGWVMGRRFNPNQEGYEMAIVIAEDREQVIGIAEQISNLGFMANTPQEFIQGVNSFFVVLQVIFGGVGGVALLVAAIGIANTMTMAILERTREIGLMKAVGATNRDVLSIFLGEAAGIGFIGGVGGILLGVLGGKLINVLGSVYMAGQSSGGYGGMGSGISVVTPAWLILFAIAFSTLIGLLSGLYPALRAASLVPVRALKYE